MLKDLIEQNSATEAVIDECFCLAAAEMEKITCYDIPKPQFEDPRTLRWRADVGIVTDTFRYVLMDGKYCEQCDTYERGISYHYIGDTADDMVAHLIFEAVWQYAIHNTVTNDEAELFADKCFSLLDKKYRPYYIRRKTALQKLKEKGII